MTKEELKSVLVQHIVWLSDKSTGARANLSEVDLRWADLSEADLRWANLIGANLREADLRGAALGGAILDTKEGAK